MKSKRGIKNTKELIAEVFHTQVPKSVELRKTPDDEVLRMRYFNVKWTDP